MSRWTFDRNDMCKECDKYTQGRHTPVTAVNKLGYCEYCFESESCASIDCNNQRHEDSADGCCIACEMEMARENWLEADTLDQHVEAAQQIAAWRKRECAELVAA